MRKRVCAYEGGNLCVGVGVRACVRVCVCVTGRCGCERERKKNILFLLLRDFAT